jgi:hypothetical protein
MAHLPFAADACAVRSILKTIERSAQFIQLRITLECKDPINLMHRKAAVNERLSRPAKRILFFQAFKQLAKDQTPDCTFVLCHRTLRARGYLISNSTKDIVKVNGYVEKRDACSRGGKRASNAEQSSRSNHATM